VASSRTTESLAACWSRALPELAMAKLRDTAIAEDAPQGSAAFQKVKYQEKKQAYAFNFQAADGQKVTFQVTVKAASSRENAARIARACYAKFEAGLHKESVLEFREELYRLCGGEPQRAPEGTKRPAEQPVPPPKRLRTSGGSAAAIAKRLHDDGRADGALRIEGRSAEKKNAAVNGIYVPIPQGFEGSLAYEKVLAGPGDKGGRRFLYYSSARKRWKISDTLGDTKGGFAYLLSNAGGRRPPAPSGTGDAVWCMFDGKEAGYNADVAVTCTLLVPEANLATPSSPNGSSSSSSDDDEAGPTVSAVKAEAGNAAGTAVAAGADGAGPVVAQQVGDAAGGPGTGVDGPEELPTPRPPQLTRICAKVAVRTNLRCACHYTYLPDCPAQRK